MTEYELVKCSKCGKDTHPLDIFPEGLCLECYRPTGEALHRIMTGEKLAQMWGSSTDEDRSEEEN